jgi:hypothetical protein
VKTVTLAGPPENETEHAWAAGFFDGEGCAHARKSAHGPWRKPNLSISQVDRRPLDRFCDAVGVDRQYVRGPRRQGGYGNKGVYEVSLNSLPMVIQVLDAIGPYLSEPKREQVASMMAQHEEGKRVAAARRQTWHRGRSGAPRDSSGRFLPSS